jgi:PRC-barrel domain
VEARGLVGLEARTADGGEVGRIAEMITDEESGEVTHVIIERDAERFEVPISAISLDPDADFATFHADRSDEEPGEHVGDREEPESYESDEGDYEGQLVDEPVSVEELEAKEDLESREDWEDETDTPDSGYPRNDSYIDPETGKEVVDPLLEENEGLEDDVEDLLADTNLEVRSVEDGVVELAGAVATQEDLEQVIEEVMGLDGILEVDTTDIEVG